MSPLALSLRFLQAQPDSRLVALAREGHDAAFEALVRRYRRGLLAYCRRLQPGNAEDTLQQALLQSWKALKAGAEVREARPWLYRIAHNVAMSNLRAPGAVAHEADDAAGPELHQVVEQRLQVRAALAGMAALPTLQRDAIVSTALAGATHEEVGAALGLSGGAVRGLIYRARATLRAAAAAITPSPVLMWVLRRAEARTGAVAGMLDGLSFSGSAGVAGLVAKGAAVLTLAGAAASSGGVILANHLAHHHPKRGNLGTTTIRPAGSPLSTAPGSASAAAASTEHASLTPAWLAASRAGRSGARRSRGVEVRHGWDRGSGSDGSGGSDGGRRGQPISRGDAGSTDGPAAESDGSSFDGRRSAIFVAGSPGSDSSAGGEHSQPSHASAEASESGDSASTSGSSERGGGGGSSDFQPEGGSGGSLGGDGTSGQTDRSTTAASGQSSTSGGESGSSGSSGPQETAGTTTAG